MAPPSPGDPAAPHLFPRPRRLAVTGVGPAVDHCPVSEVHDPSLPAEGYLLRVDDHGATLAHADDAGRRYGRATLDQLRTGATDGRMAAVHIEDHPDVAVRGFMLDVSRDRVPTRATLERYVELLELARYNQLQLYIEHTFAHAGLQAVWADASPLHPDDLRWLDDRCAAAGIELVVNRNCFGHFERWLRLAGYRDRAEAPDGVEVMPGLRFPAAVLAPTADNAAFALGLVREQLACVRSHRVNIGCDETFELGRGASAAACAKRGTGAVYLEHLRRLADPLVADGYQVQVWADVLRRHPELAGDLPPQVVPIAWGYEAPCEPADLPDLPAELVAILGELGVDTDTSGGFAANVAPLVDAAIPFWVAPGTGDWNSLVGRWDNALANQLDAAEVARAHGAGGYLVTAWGDNGHHHPPPITWGPLLHGGAVAWGLDANRHVHVAAVLDRHVFGDAGGGIGRTLEALGRLWRETGRRAWNASPLAAALFPHLPLIVTGRPDPDLVRSTLAVIDASIADLERTRPGAGPGPVAGGLDGRRLGAADDAQVVAEVSVAARLARQGAWRLLPPSDPATPSVAERAEDLAHLIDEQGAAWLGRAHPGGLPDSLAHLERTLAADRARLDG
jgi:hypothetical protein